MAWVATAIIGSAVIGGAASYLGSSKAASAQEQAAQTAANTSMNMYNTTRNDLAPYRAIGSTSADQLTKQMPDLTAPISFDASTLANTPGYQFNLTQGLKSTQKSAAARGLGVSGAALKGAASFATGLSDSTYGNQFNYANTNKTNAFNRLSSLVNTGENAGAQTGNAGTSAANTSASAAIASGNAAAAGANAAGSAISNTANGIGGYIAYNGLYGNNVGNMPATGLGSPTTAQSNAYAISQGINPYA